MSSSHSKSNSSIKRSTSSKSSKSTSQEIEGSLKKSSDSSTVNIRQNSSGQKCSKLVSNQGAQTSSSSSSRKTTSGSSPRKRLTESFSTPKKPKVLTEKHFPEKLDLPSTSSKFSPTNSTTDSSPDKKSKMEPNFPCSETKTGSNWWEHLPFTQIRNIMMSTPGTISGGKQQGSPSKKASEQEEVYAMTIAAEEFIAMLARGAYECWSEKPKHTKEVSYNDLADFVHENENLSVIHEIVPRKVKFSAVRELVLAAQKAHADTGE